MAPTKSGIRVALQAHLKLIDGRDSGSALDSILGPAAHARGWAEGPWDVRRVRSCSSLISIEGHLQTGSALKLVNQRTSPGMHT